MGRTCESSSKQITQEGVSVGWGKGVWRFSELVLGVALWMVLPPVLLMVCWASWIGVSWVGWSGSSVSGPLGSRLPGRVYNMVSLVLWDVCSCQMVGTLKIKE